MVESTSGNLGLALAGLLARLDCQLVAVVNPKLPSPVRELLLAEGAELVTVHDRDSYGGYLLTRLAKVGEKRRADPQLRWTDQYNNPANPAAHRQSIAAELVNQTRGKVDAVLAAVSTGGTLVGLSEGLRAAVPRARVFAIDVRGSLATLSKGHAHLLTGIGATRTSSFLRRHHYDHALRVLDTEAFAYCRMLQATPAWSWGIERRRARRLRLQPRRPAGRQSPPSRRRGRRRRQLPDHLSPRHSRAGSCVHR